MAIFGKIRQNLTRCDYTRQGLAGMGEIWGYLSKLDMVRSDSADIDRNWPDLTGYDMMGQSLTILGNVGKRSIGFVKIGPTHMV